MSVPFSQYRDWLASPECKAQMAALIAELARLREERDAATAMAATAYGASLNWEEVLKDDALWFAQDDIAKSRVACMAAEAERDRLTADLAAAEAQIEALRGAAGKLLSAVDSFMPNKRGGLLLRCAAEEARFALATLPAKEGGA